MRMAYACEENDDDDDDDDDECACMNDDGDVCNYFELML